MTDHKPELSYGTVPLHNTGSGRYSGSIALGPLRAHAMTFSCGAGHVSISVETGKVTLTDCEVDDAAKAFWKAVETFAPVRRS